MPADRSRSDSFGEITASYPVSSSRTAIRVACEKCRGRKIKCTGERPQCARCSRLALPCEYVTAPPTWTMVSTLEQRIQALEAEKEVIGLTTGAHAESSDHSEPVAMTPRQVSVGRRENLNPVSVRSPNIPVNPPSDGPLQLPSNAQLLDQLPPTVGIPSPLTEARGEPNMSMCAIDRSILPDQAGYSQLLDHFFHYTNAAFPIMHAPSLRAMVDRVCGAFAMAPSRDILVTLYVLAVGCASLPRSSRLYTQYRNREQVFYDAAGQVEADSPPVDNFTKLQVLILKTQFVLYSPNAGNVWDLSGAAVRTAVDLGLHNETGRSRGKTILQQDMERRLFWSAYCLDRILSYGLGRPPAISDDWITAQLPLDCDDSLITENAVLPGGSSPLKLSALAHFKIRRLQSEIQHTLYCPSEKIRGLPPREWYDSVLHRLDDWRRSNPPTNGYASKQWFDLNFYHTKILLFRPAPNCPTPNREGLESALIAASGMMRTYKEMYRMGRINYNWLAMYQLFTAGVTYLNSLWQAQKSGWVIIPAVLDAVLDIQVCTSVMEALAALTPGTASIRNAFENVSERIIRHLTSRAGGFSAPSSPRTNGRPISPRAEAPSDVGGDTSWMLPFEISDLDNAAGSPSTGAHGYGVTQWNTTDPLESFFMQPLGEMTELDWEQAALLGTQLDFNN